MKCKIPGCNEQVLNDVDPQGPLVRVRDHQYPDLTGTIRRASKSPRDRICFYHRKLKAGLLEPFHRGYRP
ncbi:MAG: hypothetical protein PVG49_22005 [Desulfobacteraceae bacterium]